MASLGRYTIDEIEKDKRWEKVIGYIFTVYCMYVHFFGLVVIYIAAPEIKERKGGYSTNMILGFSLHYNIRF